VEESCDGVGNDCPTDVFVAATTPCREAQGDCDTPESCTGNSAACPEEEVIECPFASITPTGTTCEDYRDDNFSLLPPIEYKVKQGAVFQVNPGVFFYYDKVTVTTGPVDITVTQSNDEGWKNLLINSTSQVLLYDLDCNHVIVGDFDAATGTVTFPNVGNGSYIIGIQYSANSAVGQPESDSPLPIVEYTFNTIVDALPPSGVASIEYQPK
jgi:hypothetical protein